MRPLTLVLGVLVLLVVSSTVLPIIDNATEDPGWYYGEYRQIEGATSASGSLEIVDGMVHASDVGSGEILFADGSVEMHQVGRAVLDVNLMAGQSNATYRRETVSVSEASPVPKPGTAYIWATSDGDYSGFYRPGRATPEMLPMTSSDGSSLTGGLAPSLASAYNETTGNCSYWICGAWAGKSISTFDPYSGSTWRYMVEVVGAAISSVDSSKFILRPGSYVWLQGEQDSAMPVETYQQRFLKMHDAILEGDLGFEFNHCFISLPRLAVGGNSVAAQISLAEADPETITIATDVADTFTEANGLLWTDGIHYTQLGDNVIGVALGEACAAHAPTDGVKSVNASLLSSIPIILGVAVGLMAIGLVLRAIMGRD